MSDRGKEDEEKEGFKVTDRRKFTAEGDLREGVEESAPEEEEPTRTEIGGRPADAGAARAPEPQGAGKTPDAGSAVGGADLGESTGEQAAGGVDFSSFVLSLATSAMVQMGEIPDPASGRRAFSLEGAKQMIEIISMLQKKTEGNLDPDESQMLDGILYELRMKYLEKSRK